jgi:hypothetical protein
LKENITIKETSISIEIITNYEEKTKYLTLTESLTLELQLEYNTEKIILHERIDHLKNTNKQFEYKINELENTNKQLENKIDNFFQIILLLIKENVYMLFDKLN